MVSGFSFVIVLIVFAYVALEAAGRKCACFRDNKVCNKEDEDCHSYETSCYTKFTKKGTVSILKVIRANTFDPSLTDKTTIIAERGCSEEVSNTCDMNPLRDGGIEYTKHCLGYKCNKENETGLADFKCTDPKTQYCFKCELNSNAIDEDKCKKMDKCEEGVKSCFTKVEKKANKTTIIVEKGCSETENVILKNSCDMKPLEDGGIEYTKYCLGYKCNKENETGLADFKCTDPITQYCFKCELKGNKTVDEDKCKDTAICNKGVKSCFTKVGEKDKKPYFAKGCTKKTMEPKCIKPTPKGSITAVYCKGSFCNDQTMDKVKCPSGSNALVTPGLIVFITAGLVLRIM